MSDDNFETSKHQTNSGGNVPIGDVSANGIGHDGNGHDNTPMSVPKPVKNMLDMFKSTRNPSIAGVGTPDGITTLQAVGGKGLGAPASG
jgi:hypothetical protein